MARHLAPSRPTTTWLDLQLTVGDLLLGLTLALGTASLLATSLGDPETMAVVALTGFTVALLGTAVLHCARRLSSDADARLVQ